MTCLERMEKSMTRGAVANITFPVFAGTYHKRLEGLVTAEIPDSLFQPGIGRKDMS